MCNQLGGSGLETSILPKTMQEIELHTKFECPARAYQDEYCTGCNPQFVKHCLKSTAKDNTTKKKNNQRNTQTKTVIWCLYFVFCPFFPTGWNFSKTIFAVMFLISWVKMTFLGVKMCLQKTCPVSMISSCLSAKQGTCGPRILGAISEDTVIVQTLSQAPKNKDLHIQ